MVGVGIFVGVGVRVGVLVGLVVRVGASLNLSAGFGVEDGDGVTGSGVDGTFALQAASSTNKDIPTQILIEVEKVNLNFMFPRFPSELQVNFIATLNV